MIPYPIVWHGWDWLPQMNTSSPDSFALIVSGAGDGSQLFFSIPAVHAVPPAVQSHTRFNVESEKQETKLSAVGSVFQSWVRPTSLPFGELLLSKKRKLEMGVPT